MVSLPAPKAAVNKKLYLLNAALNSYIKKKTNNKYKKWKSERFYGFCFLNNIPLQAAKNFLCPQALHLVFRGIPNQDLNRQSCISWNRDKDVCYDKWD